MRRYTIFSILMMGLLIINVGCQTTGKPQLPYTAEHNPTVLAGRGEPHPDEYQRPAAWVLIDGYEGHFLCKTCDPDTGECTYHVEDGSDDNRICANLEGHPQVQFEIDETVSAKPTFRAEVYEPLLGVPHDFNCLLKSRDDEEGSMGLYYAIEAKPGTFEVRKWISLVSPGKDFVIKDLSQAGMNIVEKIPPLPPGKYTLAAGIKNTEKGQEAAAITYFTVE